LTNSTPTHGDVSVRQELAAGMMGFVSFWDKADIDRRPDLIGFDAFDPKRT
jgi:hypothetical protein